VASSHDHVIGKTELFATGSRSHNSIWIFPESEEVSFSIKLAASAASGWAELCLPCVLSCRSFSEAGSPKGEEGNR
jgi:hypothetical protein